MKGFCGTRSLLFGATAVAACSVGMARLSYADELPVVPVIPAQTNVLILPALDETGDKPEMQLEHIRVASHRLEYEFMTRGFKVMGPKDGLRVARTEGIDLDDPDDRGSLSLKTIGKDTGAQWVVSVAVIDVHEDKGYDAYSRRAFAKVQVKVYDINQGGYISNRFQQSSKTSLPLVGRAGTTGLFKHTIDTTVQRSVSDILTPYPQTVKVAGEFEENDLLDSSPTVPAQTAESAAPIPPATAPSAPAPGAPAPVASPTVGKAVLTMNSGAHIPCTILSFDGTTYQIQKEDGTTEALPSNIIQSVEMAK